MSTQIEIEKSHQPPPPYSGGEAPVQGENFTPLTEQPATLEAPHHHPHHHTRRSNEHVHVPPLERLYTRAPTDQLRIQAIIMALIGCFCGAWVCSVPAFVLALLPECFQSSLQTNPKTFYAISILLSVIAMITALVLFLTISWQYSFFSVFYITHDEKNGTTSS